MTATVIPFPDRTQTSVAEHVQQDGTVRALDHRELTLEQVRAILAPAREAIAQARDRARKHSR